MIAKQVALRTARKSDFSDLVRYIIATQGKGERVGRVVLTNCASDTPLDAAFEVRLTQQQNTRSGADKTYHLVVSFRAGEQPSAQVLTAIEQRLCEGLGFGDHQRVSASHHDTDHLHVHIAINKVHPIRHTVHAPYYDHLLLAKLCEELETTYGLQRDNHATLQRGAQGRAVDMEQRSGVESLIGWVQRNCVERLQAASSWPELHDTLYEHGLALQVRANGFVITDQQGHHAKSSSIHRSLSKPQLEQRLGPFEPSRHSSDSHGPALRTRYEKKPLPSKVDTEDLYARYQEERELIARARRAETAVLWQRQLAQRERLKRTSTVQRAAIQLLGGDRLTRKALYALAARSREADLAQLRDHHRRERQFLGQQFRQRVWADWLQTQAARGDPQAEIALQARQGRSTRQVAGSHGAHRMTAQANQAVAPVDATWFGAETHRTGSTFIRDAGHRLEVARGAEATAVEAALRIAIQRYGHRLQVAGSDSFKACVLAGAVRAALPVTFADAALEQRRQALSSLSNQDATHDNFERRRAAAGGIGTAQPGARNAAHVGHVGSRASGGGRSASSPRTTGADGAPSSVTAAAGAGDRTTRRGKPHVGRIGSQPPAAARNGLRNLSELGVVQLARSRAVLLPGDVPGRLEQRDAQPDHALRRSVPGAGELNAAEAAADRFIAERNGKRGNINDISKHSRYTEVVKTTGCYGGTRNVDGHWLALLQRDGAVEVVPVDAPTAFRLKRLRIGDAVTVQPHPQGQVTDQAGGPATASTYTFMPLTDRTISPRKGRSR